MLSEFLEKKEVILVILYYRIFEYYILIIFLHFVSKFKIKNNLKIINESTFEFLIKFLIICIIGNT